MYLILCVILNLGNQVLKRKLIEVGEKSVNSKFNKNKIDLLQKKKVAEEQKKKLDKLQITTKELTKAPLKSKVLCFIFFKY